MSFEVEFINVIGFPYVELSRKKEDGSTLYIRVRNKNMKFEIDVVGVKGKRKRNIEWASSKFHNDYDFRRAKGKERFDMEMNAFAKMVGVDVLNEALETAWKLFKPEPLVIIPSQEEDDEF